MMDEIEDRGTRSTFSWAVGWMGLLALGALLAYQNKSWGPLIIEDGFRALRVAFNFSEGQGLVFNVGDDSASPPSPLAILILALGIKGGLTPLDASVCLSLGSAWLTAAFVVFAGRSLLWRVSATLSLAVMLLVPDLIRVHLSGSEIGLLGALICGGMVFFIRGQLFVAGLLAALAALTRLEGLAFSILLLGAILIGQRRGIWLFLAGLALPLVGWEIYAILGWGNGHFPGLTPISKPSLSAVSTINLSPLNSEPSLQICWILAALGLFIEMIQRTRALGMGLIALIVLFSSTWMASWEGGFTRLSSWSAFAMVPVGFFFVARLIHWMAHSLAGQKWGLLVALVVGCVPLAFAFEGDVKAKLLPLNELSVESEAQRDRYREMARVIEEHAPGSGWEIWTRRTCTIGLESSRWHLKLASSATLLDVLSTREPESMNSMIILDDGDDWTADVGTHPLLAEHFVVIATLEHGEGLTSKVWVSKKHE